MDFEKLTNLFEMKNRIGYLIIYWTIISFINNFSTLLLCKINFLKFFRMGDFFLELLLFCEVLKLRSNQTIGWECTCYTPLKSIF